MSRKARIAVFLPSLNGGGAERAMVLFAQTIHQLGYDVELVCAEKTGVLVPLVDVRFPIVDLKAPRMVRAIRGLRGYLKDRKPDVIYSTIVHANLALLIASIGLKKQTRIVVRESNAPISEAKRTVSRRLSHFLVPYFYPSAHAVIAVSARVRDELVKLCGKLSRTTAVLETPVIPANFVTQAAEEPNHPWFKPGEPPVVLGVGRLHPQKNFPLLIRAFAEARKQKECRLIILGQGGLLDDLQKLAGELGVSEYISFPGFSLNPFSFMSRARVFVLSSDYEGMPNVLIQAMALGTPVISTDCPGGSAECLENGKLGTLIPVNDQERLTKAIIEAFDAPHRSDVAEITRRRFGAEYASWEYLAIAGVAKENTLESAEASTR